MQLKRQKDRDGSAPVVPCPGCGADALFSPSNPYRPFCSERCRQMDLGGWASERFRVADPSPPHESQEPEDPDERAPSGPH